MLLYFDYEVHSGSERFLELTDENIASPYQSICDFFISTMSFYDDIGKTLASHVLNNTPKLTSGQYDALNRSNTIRKIEALLSAAQKRGRIPQDRDCSADAEYLMMSANGISTYWMTFSEDQTCVDVAAKFFPMIFSSLIDRKIEVKTSVSE